MVRSKSLINSSHTLIGCQLLMFRFGRSVDGFDNSICKGGKEKEDVEDFLNFRKQTSLVCKLKIQRILKWLRM